MNILVTGGAGYIGTLLTKKLLNLNHKVIVLDTFWFGNHLPNHKNLRIIKKDILNIKERDLGKIDVVYHLASVANDAASMLDTKLTWEISCQGTLNLCNICKKLKVKKFIFASSGSVYGIKKEKRVTENLSLKPISDYNKTKMIAEKVIESFSPFFKIYLVRPGTVFGYSPRMRLDLMINILTFHALQKKKITVFGGSQTRPFIHIQDMTDLYLHFLNKNLRSGIYNASSGNLTANKTATEIKKLINCKIIKKKSNDPRSYRLSSEKIKKTGFKFNWDLKKGVLELIEKFNEKKILNKKEYYSINWLKKYKKI